MAAGTVDATPAAFPSDDVGRRVSREREAGRLDASVEHLEKPGFQQIPVKTSTNVDER